MDIEAAIIIITLMRAVVFKRRKIERSRRRWWSRPCLLRRNEGTGRGVLAMAQNELRVEDTQRYMNFFRMDEKTFNVLLEKVRPRIQRQNTNMRESISAAARLGATLRFLATGDTYHDLHFYTRIAPNTLSGIIPEVIDAIIEELREEYLKAPSTEAEWKRVSQEFQALWNFPNCIGAIDGKHVAIRPPHLAASFYRNYKGFDSIVLMAVVDANYRFLCVDIGANGRISDGGVFRRSNFYTALKGGYLNIPNSTPLPGCRNPVPYVFVADDAFPLQKHIMKPFKGTGLSNNQKIYNYRLSRARRTVENAFGQLVNRFRILLNPINLSVEKIEKITLACCILHNMLSKHMPNVDVNSEISENVRNIEKQCSNHSSRESMTIRHEFQEYFASNGAVPWQQDMVNLHSY